MKRHLKTVARGMGMGILIGIVLYVICDTLDIEEKTFQTAVLIISLAVILGAMIFNILYMRPFRKRVRNQIALLEEGNPAQALADMEQMLEDGRVKKTKYLKRLCRLNMTAAYCDLEQYDRAMEIFLELSAEKFSGTEELVYSLNLCVCHFYQGQEKEGLMVYNRSRRVFDRYRKDRFYGGNIAVVTMWAMMAQGQNGQVEELLEKARKTWDRPSLQEDYQKVEDRLALASAKDLGRAVLEPERKNG